MSPLVLLALAACHSDYVMTERVPGTLSLTLDSPEYGAFLGDELITVSGTVYPSQARLVIEDQVIQPDEGGAFTLTLPVDGPYRIVDVEASLDAQQARERVPVFSGHDPMDTWPGGLTGRLLPAGLAGVGDALGAVIDELGWADTLAALLPSIETDWVDLVPVGITHDPTVVELTPDADGVAAAITLNNVAIEYELVLDWASYSTTMSLGFGQIAIGGLLDLWLDADGVIWAALTDPRVDLDDADVQLGALDGWVIEWIMDGIDGWIIEPLAELILDLVVSQFDELQLGGPIEFETDLMGTGLAVRLSDLYGDLDGVAAELGVGIGEDAATSPMGIPVPGEDGADNAELAMGLHEGLIQSLMGEMVFDLLSQDIDLSGSFGEVLGAGIRALPGGDQAPDGDGWCLSIQPGPAYASRMQEGIDPLAVVYIPDVVVDVGVMQGSSCDDWLVASLALELDLNVDEGTKIGMGLDVPEGALLYYGAEDVDEDEVIGGLGDWLGGMLSLLGGSFSFDLADLAGGGALPVDISPSIVDSTQLTDQDGQPVEGLFSVSMMLFAE